MKKRYNSKSKILFLGIFILILLVVFQFFYLYNKIDSKNFEINSRLETLEKLNNTSNTIINNYPEIKNEEITQRLECVILSSSDKEISILGADSWYPLKEVANYGKPYLESIPLLASAFYEGIQCLNESGWVIVDATVPNFEMDVVEHFNVHFDEKLFFQDNGAYTHNDEIQVTCCRII